MAKDDMANKVIGLEEKKNELQKSSHDEQIASGPSAFKVYYIAIAPGLVNCTLIIAIEIKEDHVCCEWFYVNCINGVPEAYKGTLKYPIEIYGDNFDLIFNTMLFYCKGEIINKIVWPYIKDDPLKNSFYNNIDLLIPFNEIDKSILVILNVDFKKLMDEIKERSENTELKKFIENINKIEFKSGEILECKDN
jgi:hypothetical protein